MLREPSGEIIGGRGCCGDSGGCGCSRCLFTIAIALLYLCRKCYGCNRRQLKAIVDDAYPVAGVLATATVTARFVCVFVISVTNDAIEPCCLVPKEEMRSNLSKCKIADIVDITARVRARRCGELN